jgi:ADP-ribose pyrophosphatase YjhB (NUDIX family)
MNHDHSNLLEEPDFQFCPVCGGSLESSKLKENEPARLVCSDCQFIFYLDPKLVASSVVELDGGIVLLRRSIEPQKGKWVVPGGYVDRGEAVEAAALRETEEECGIRTRIKNLLGVYSYPGRAVVVAVYVAEYVTGDLAVGEEALEVKQFRLDEIPWNDLAFPSTVDALKDYCHLKDGSG